MTRPRGYANSPGGSSGADKFSGSPSVASRNRLLRFLATNAASALPMGYKTTPSPCPMH